MVPRMKVYVSTTNFGFGSLPEVFSDLDHRPYRAVEISSGHPWDSRSWNVISKYAREHNAAVLLHNYAPPGPDKLFINLSHPNLEEREKIIAFLKSRIDYTAELGSDYYSFHGGYRVPYQFGVRSYDSSQRLDRRDALGIFVDGAIEVVAHGEARGVHVGVENHVVERGNEDNLILYGIEDFEFLLGAVNSDYLHVHLDVGHLKVTSRTMNVDKRAFLSQLGTKIMAAHLHENDGIIDSHGLFGQDLWFLEVLVHLPGLRYACLETSQQDQADIAAMMRILEGANPAD